MIHCKMRTNTPPLADVGTPLLDSFKSLEHDFGLDDLHLQNQLCTSLRRRYVNQELLETARRDVVLDFPHCIIRH